MDSRCLDLLTDAAGSCRITPVLLLLAVGCGPGGPPTLEGFGETGFGEGDGDGDPGDGDGDAPGDGDGDPGSNECIDLNLGSQPEVFVSELFDPDQAADHASLCGEPTQGPDYSMAWTAPFTAIFRAELFSDLPSALQVREGECDGSSVACELAGFPSIIEFEAIAGQRYTFIADTLFDDLAFFDFFLYPVDEPPPPPPPPGSCPDGELPSQTSLSINGQTNGASNDFVSGCGGEAAPERSFIYVPPVSGVYRIDTLGSNYDTMLYVLDGPCAGPEIECNDDTFELLSQVVVELSAGQPYTVIVDGWGESAGSFQLNINLDEEQASLCDPIVELGSNAPELDFWAGSDFFTPVFQGCTDFPLERRFRWTAPASGLYRAAVEGQGSPAALAVLPGGCGGGGALCSQGLEGEVLFDALEGQEIVLVAEWIEAFGELGLSITSLNEPSPGCGESLGQGLPVAVSGSTNGGGDQFNGSCSVNGAPEREFHWVPAASGSYKISLEGSNYDTLLYVRRGDCDGEEIACVDDTFVNDTWFLWSAVDVDVEQGETISIFVDGYNGSGNFDLTITQN